MELQPHDFRFTLTCKGKDWVLPQAPDEWEESTLQWARSDAYYGVIRSFSVPLRFVLDGAWLLRRVMYTEGIDGVCMITIELLNRSTWEYDTVLYKGDIDFSTFDDVLDAVDAKLMDFGVSAAVNAYSNVEYEFPVSGEGVVDVRLPGIDLIEIATAFPFYLNVSTFGYFPGLDIQVNELFSEHVTVQAQPFNSPGPPLTPSPTGWFIEGQNPTTETRIHGYLDYFHFMVPGYYYQVLLVNSSGATLAELYNTLGVPPAETHLEFDVTINIAAGQHVYFLIKRQGSGGNIVPPFFRIDGGSVSVSYGVTTEPSIVKAFRPKRLLDLLISRMNRADITVNSNLLGSQWDNLLITSGDAIRGIENALLKTKFDDFFKSIDAVLNAGFGIHMGVPSLESKSFFFRSGLQIIDLGDSVKNVHVRPSERYMFNSIKTGYPNDDYEVDRGREEYNSTQVWSTPIERMKKQLDLVSVYRADQYGIEQLRIAVLNDQRDNVNEVDKKNDNGVYFIHAQKTPGVDGVFDVIGAENYVDISGISTRSSSYNLEITPKKNMLRHADWIASGLYLTNGSVTFESAEKNADLSTTDLSGRTVLERENIPISSLGSPLFLPFEVELITDLQINAWRIITENPTGYIRFVWREHEFYGFILDVSQNIERNSERSFTLLLTPNCDITKLIN